MSINGNTAPLLTGHDLDRHRDSAVPEYPRILGRSWGAAACDGRWNVRRTGGTRRKALAYLWEDLCHTRTSSLNPLVRPLSDGRA